MKEIIVRDKSFEFAVRIINLSIFLRESRKEFVLSKQILRSGTSIGANIEEATGAVSKAEFKFKLSIAYKESRETHYWLRLLFRTKYIDNRMYKSLQFDCEELKKLLYASLKGLK
ncbi:MAG: four helix bundle protein [Ignavibacteria bacterium]|nr:four helix bundle protein [Ignavibacteria bacterium]